MKKTKDIFGMVGLFAAILGFMLSFIFSVVAVIFGAIGITRKDTVKGLSWFSLVAGLAELIIVVVALC